MSDDADDTDPLQAVHGDEIESDEEADEVFAGRALEFDAVAEIEGAPAAEPEESTAKETAKKARKEELDRYQAAIKAKNVRFIHLDIESGGEDVGIVQLSAVAHDSGTNLQVGDSFEEYVKPHSRITANDWSRFATAVHGLHHNDPRITSFSILLIKTSIAASWKITLNFWISSATVSKQILKHELVPEVANRWWHGACNHISLE